MIHRLRRNICDMLIEQKGDDYIFLEENNNIINVYKRGQNNIGSPRGFIRIDQALTNGFYNIYFYSRYNGFAGAPIRCMYRPGNNPVFSNFL